MAKIYKNLLKYSKYPRIKNIYSIYSYIQRTVSFLFSIYFLNKDPWYVYQTITPNWWSKRQLQLWRKGKGKRKKLTSFNACMYIFFVKCAYMFDCENYTSALKERQYKNPICTFKLLVEYIKIGVKIFSDDWRLF